MSGSNPGALGYIESTVPPSEGKPAGISPRLFAATSSAPSVSTRLRFIDCAAPAALWLGVDDARLGDPAAASAMLPESGAGRLPPPALAALKAVRAKPRLFLCGVRWMRGREDC